MFCARVCYSLEIFYRDGHERWSKKIFKTDCSLILDSAHETHEKNTNRAIVGNLFNSEQRQRSGLSSRLYLGERIIGSTKGAIPISSIALIKSPWFLQSIFCGKHYLLLSRYLNCVLKSFFWYSSGKKILQFVLRKSIYQFLIRIKI